jgi:hypothetical protein
VRAGLLWAAGAAALVFSAAAAQARDFVLFPEGATPNLLAPGGPFDERPGAFDFGAIDLSGPTGADPAAPPQRRCVLLQCVTPAPTGTAPAPKIFTTPISLWTGAAALIGIVNAAQAPINYGTQRFHVTDEGWFQTWTYSGGLDKASHFTVSANVAGLMYDAYRLNGLSPDQSFGLSFATTFLGGVIVEVGDGISPYGFSAQDLTADTLGTLAGVLVKRYGLDDLIWFSLGKIPTTIPVGDDTASLGSDYSNEMYTMNLKLAGLAPRFHAQPWLERFFQFSFAYLTKGYGYQPPLPGRYQEIGLEIGLNFHEILKAFGVSESTWWGDTLLRAANFIRVPYTQIGAYYNLTNGKWYGPGAPYHYSP